MILKKLGALLIPIRLLIPIHGGAVEQMRKGVTIYALLKIKSTHFGS